MAIAIRMAQTTWEGPLASGTGTVRLGSGVAGELPVTWAAAVPQRLAVTATVTLDQAGGVPAIVSSHLDVTARVPGLDHTAFGTAVGEASALCPVSRLFAGAKITVDATLEPAS